MVLQPSSDRDDPPKSIHGVKRVDRVVGNRWYDLDSGDDEQLDDQSHL